MHMSILDIGTFLLNHNVHKNLNGLGFWATDPLIDRFHKHLSIKGYVAQKPRQHELL